MNDIDPRMEKFFDYVERYGNESMQDLVENVDKSAKSIKDLNREVTAGRAGYKDMKSKLDSLTKSIDEANEAALDYAKSGDASNATAKRSQAAALEAQRSDLAKAAAAQRSTEAWEKAGEETVGELGKFGAAVGKSAVNGVKTFVTGLQSGASGAQIGAGLLTAAIDIAAAGATMLSKGMEGLGKAMAASMNPYIAVGGMVLAALGSVAEAATKASADVAKFGVEVLSKEVDKQVKAFNDMSSSGALFANGMTGMRDAAHAAGLTVDQFASVVKSSSEQLASSGMGVAEGAKKVGDVLSKGGPTMQKNLRNLGYGFEEQASLVADVIKDMRQSQSGPLKASSAEVAQQTMKYAENLRIISDITGEDAKKKMDQVRDQASQLAFQQKLDGMSETQRQNVINAMGNMSDMERKNFMDTVVFGTVINKAGAVMAARSGDLAASTKESVDAMRAGTLDDKKQREIEQRRSAGIQKDMIGATDIGLAGAAGVGGIAGELATEMGKELQWRKNMTPEAIAAAEKAAQAQEHTTDKLTGTINNVEVEAQRFKKVLEEKLTGPMEKFGTTVDAMLGVIQQQIDKFGTDVAESTPEKKTIERGHQGEGWFKNLFRSDQDTLKEQKRDDWLKEHGYTAAAYGMTMDKDNNNIPLNEVPGMPKDLQFAKGGVAQGPTSGFAATLHGTEAVVPLPDGKKIPVEMNMKTDMLEQMLSKQHNVLTKILSAMETNNGLTKDILSYTA